MDERRFSDLKYILGSARAVLWETGGGGEIPTSSDFGVIEGLARTLWNENYNLELVIASLQRSGHALRRNSDHIVQILNQTLMNPVKGGWDTEYTEKDQHLGVNRLVEVEQLRNSISQDS